MKHHVIGSLFVALLAVSDVILYLSVLLLRPAREEKYSNTGHLSIFFPYKLVGQAKKKRNVEPNRLSLCRCNTHTHTRYLLVISVGLLIFRDADFRISISPSCASIFSPSPTTKPNNVSVPYLSRSVSTLVRSLSNWKRMSAWQTQEKKNQIHIHISNNMANSVGWLTFGRSLFQNVAPNFFS